MNNIIWNGRRTIMRCIAMLILMISFTTSAYSCRQCSSKYEHLYSSVNSSECIYIGKILKPKDSAYWWIEVELILKDSFIEPSPPDPNSIYAKYYSGPKEKLDTVFVGQLRTKYFGNYTPPKRRFIFSEYIHSYTSYEILNIEYLDEVIYLLDTTVKVNSICEAFYRLEGESKESTNAGLLFIKENSDVAESEISEKVKERLIEMRMNAFTNNDVKLDIGTSRKLLNILTEDIDTFAKNFILSELQMIKAFKPEQHEINLLDIPFMGETYLGEFLSATYAKTKKDSLFQIAIKEEMQKSIKQSQTASSIYFVYALAKNIENLDFLLNLNPKQTEYALLGLNYALEEDPYFTTYIWNDEYLKDLRTKLEKRIEEQ